MYIKTKFKYKYECILKDISICNEMIKDDIISQCNTHGKTIMPYINNLHKCLEILENIRQQIRCQIGLKMHVLMTNEFIWQCYVCKYQNNMINDWKTCNKCSQGINPFYFAFMNQSYLFNIQNLFGLSKVPLNNVCIVYLSVDKYL